MKKSQIVEKLHQSINTIKEVKDTIVDLFEEYEPEIYNKFQNSIEIITPFEIHLNREDGVLLITFNISLPYSYEPCGAISSHSHFVMNGFYAPIL